MKGCVAIILARDMRIHVFPFGDSDFAQYTSREDMERYMLEEEHVEGHPVFTSLWEAFCEARVINHQTDVPVRLLKGGYNSKLAIMRRHGIKHNYSKGVWDNGIVFCLKYALSDRDAPYWSDYIDSYKSMQRFITSGGTDCVHKAPNFSAPLPGIECFREMLAELEAERPAYLERVLMMPDEEFDEWVENKGIPKMLHLIAYREHHLGH